MGTPADEGRVWFLGEQLAGPDPRRHTLEGRRQLDDEERRAIERSNDLIIRAVGDAGYGRCLALADVVRERLSGLGENDAGASQTTALRSAIASLQEALETGLDDASALITQFSEETESVDAIAHQGEQVRASEPWSAIAPMIDASAGIFARHKSGRIVWQAAGQGDRILDVEVAVVSAVALSQTVQIQTFLLLEDAIYAAARSLRQLTVEVPSGAPLLVAFPAKESEAPQMTPIVLAIDKIGPAIRAVQLAKQVRGSAGSTATAHPASNRAAESDQSARVAAPSVDSSNAADQAVQADGAPNNEQAPDAQEPGKSQEGTPLAAAATDEAGTEATAGADQPPPDPAPVDIEALFALNLTLVTSLSQEWSRALESAALKPALAEQLARLEGLLLSLQRQVQVDQGVLEQTGVSPKIERWPPALDQLSDLELEPSSDQQLELQLRLARLEALSQVAAVTRALREPTTTVLSIGPDEGVERFWDAGAFSILANRIRLLERISRCYEAALASLGGETTIATTRPTVQFEQLMLGERAWSAGDPEAAILHGIAALRAVVDAEEELESAAGERLKERTDLPQDAIGVVRIAIRAGQHLGAGRLIDTAALTLIAEPFLGIVGAMAMPPIPGPTGSIEDLAATIEAEQPATSPLE